MIFGKEKDFRLVTVRRGGTLSDEDHHRFAFWAADCAEHVLHLFEQERPGDDRPRRAIELARGWARGELTMTQARKVSSANSAAREASGAARMAARSAAQAVVVSHVPAHQLGAAAYAIRAAREAAPEDERDQAGRIECRWQRERLPNEIRDLVVDDQRLRNDVCWHVFDC